MLYHIGRIFLVKRQTHVCQTSSILHGSVSLKLDPRILISFSSFRVIPVLPSTIFMGIVVYTRWFKSSFYDRLPQSMQFDI